MSEEFKANQSKTKNKNTEDYLFGIFPKHQFDKGALASLLSAKLISLLHYTVLKIKKKK